MPHSPDDRRSDEVSAGIVDLSRRMDNGFNRVDAKLERHTAEFTAVRKEISEGFQRMQRLMIQVGGGIVVTLLAASRFLG